MASDDTRVLHRDGAILAADDLSDDQRYFRAALARRAISRDMFGIAFGLELQQQPEPGTLRLQVTPGVAYDGAGRAIVVRSTQSLGAYFQGKAQHGVGYAIYLVPDDHQETVAPSPVLCAPARSPRLVETYDFMVELVTSALDPRPSSKREGPRLGPHEAITGPIPRERRRVRLGYVDFDGAGTATLRRVSLPPEILPAGTKPEALPLAGVQYAGLVGAGLTHPQAWTRGLHGDASVALELDPVVGVLFHDQVVHEERLLLRDDHGATFSLDASGGSLHAKLVGVPEDKSIRLLEASAKGVTIASNLTVDGAARFAKGVTVDQGAVVEGMLDVTGAAVLESSLDVHSEATFHERVHAKGGAVVGGDLSVTWKIDAYTLDVKDSLSVAGPLLARSGVAVELDVEEEAPGELKNCAVIWGTKGVRRGSSKTDAQKVLGIIVEERPGTARVVVAGTVKARVTGKVAPGDWLVLGEKGVLVRAPDKLETGKLVAKVVGPAPEGDKERLVDVLVTAA